LIKQFRLTLTGATTPIELVSESPGRTGLFIQHISDDYEAGIYARKENPHGGIYLYPHSWIFLEKDDDADKQWWIKGQAGLLIHVVEFFREKPRWIW